MKIVQPTFEIIDHNDILRNIELGGRVCYKSEGAMGEGSDERLINKLKGFKHDSVFEHGVITVKFLTDRGVTHELVRHRVASFSQESTRYCNYGKDKFGNEITVVDIRGGFPNMSLRSYNAWSALCREAEVQYLEMLDAGSSAQEARSILPNSLKTEIQVTANVREWLHILKLRTSREAHPQIRQIMVPLGWKLAQMWPVLFGEYADTEHPSPATEVL